MFERLTDVPEGVLGFRAVGEVTKADYTDVLEPAVEEALKTGDKLRVLFLIPEEWSGMAGGATWEDTRFGVAHIAKWEKVAAVTDKEWIRHSINLFGYLVPGQFRAFPLAEEAEARAWVAS